MSTPPPTAEPKRRFRWRRWLLRCAVLLAAYVLSIGPMFWTWYEAMYLNGEFWVAAFYFPLLLVSEFCPPARWLINGYINWWIT